MKKGYKKFAFALSALALLSVGAGIGAGTWANESALAEIAFVTAPEIAENYAIGDTVSLPNVKISYDGKEYDANAFLTLPNGTVVDLESYTFTEGGAYTVEYKAKTESGEILSKKLSFAVSKQVFSAGEKTVIAKGSYTNRNDATYEGLQVDLALGETFSYNKVIDLNELKATDNLFDLFVIPAREGTADITSLTFTFTDIYDESNTVTVVNRQNGDSVVNTYMQAKAPGQTLVGLHQQGKENPNYIQVNGKYYSVYRGGQYGAWLNFSYSGQGKSTGSVQKAPGEQLISLSWDYASKAVYGRTSHNLSGGGLIADLDESYMVTGWNGFTTGEVRLSITASGYTGSSARLFFPEFMGEDFEETSFSDTNAPVLTIDKGAFASGELPKAKVGGRYKLFEATAFDLQDGVRDVEVTAYYNYNTNMAIGMPIADGYLETPYAGTYTLVYTASDESGRTARERVDIVAVAEEEIKPVLTIAAASGTYVSGAQVNVPECSVTNGTADGELTISAKHKGSGKAYEVTGGKFLPLDAGEYEISYRYVNYVFDVVETATLTVTAGAKPVFLDGAILPRYMIKGMGYTLPELAGYEIASGTATETAAEIWIAEDGAENATKLNGNSYKVAAANTVKVIYKLGETELPYDIPVVNVVETTTVNGAERKSLVAGAYFYEKEGTFSRRVNTGENISYTTTDEKGTLDYINTLLATNLKLEFRAYGGITGLNIVLSERYGNDKIVLSFTDKTCSINGGAAFEIPCRFSESEGFLIDYNNETKTFIFGESVEKAAAKTVDGREFDGFEKDKVDLTVEIFGNGGEATFAIEQINNQAFPTTTDNVMPQLAHADVNGSYALGTKITLPASYVGDVFSTDLTFSMAVYKPDGESYVTTDDNVVLDGTQDPSRSYTFTLEEYGGYEVKFEWTDYFAWNVRGKSSSYNYFLYVIDEEEPTIKLSNKVLIGTVGKAIKVAKATVEDNVSASADISVHVCVKDPYGVISYVSDGEFTPTKAGTYTVSYTAYDGNGNMVTASYTVIVK